MGIKDKIARHIEKVTVRNLNKEITKYVFGRRVLDNGCGSGSFIYEKHKDKEIYGIDIVKREILRRGAREFKLASSTKIPYKKDFFDCVVYSGVIQYIKDYEKTIREIKRVLKKDGILVIATVNKDSLLRKLKIINPSPKKEAGEYNIFSFKEIINLLKKYGFRIEKILGIDYCIMPKELCSNILIIARKN